MTNAHIMITTVSKCNKALPLVTHYEEIGK